MKNSIDIRQLDEGIVLLIETTNAIYDATVVDNKDGIIEITGGYKISDPTRAILVGSSWRGKRSPYKLVKDMTVELYFDEEKLTTGRLLNLVVFGPEDEWHYDLEWNL